MSGEEGLDPVTEVGGETLVTEDLYGTVGIDVVEET